MEEKQGRRKRRWIIPVAVLAVVLALILGGLAILKTYLGQIGRTYEQPVETVAPEDEFFEVDVTPEPAPTPTPTPAEPTEVPTEEPSQTEDDSIDIDPEEVEWDFIERIEDDHLINILLVGQDKYPGAAWGKRQHSDSMILCSINPRTGETALISFLRDTYVQIPGGYSDNRLNVPYLFGGFDLLDETITVNFGVSIDCNFEVDMASFETLIDMVGGVEIELTAREAEYMRDRLDLSVTEGVNHFDGAIARRYAQIRAIGNDFARTGRQRTVLLAVFNKVKNV